jgi:hypothetical protein
MNRRHAAESGSEIMTLPNQSPLASKTMANHKHVELPFLKY